MEVDHDVTALVRAYQAGVWRYLRFLGADDALADDLTQETFLTVLRRPFEDRGAPATSGYLRTIARNLYLMSLRRHGREPVLFGVLEAQLSGGSPREAAIQDVLDLADEAFARFAADDGGAAWLDALRTCLDQLEGRARQAIEMRYAEDRSREEIAAATALSADGVKTLLRRTRDVLRQCVERRQTGE